MAAPEPADGRIVVRALASDSGQAPSFDRFGLYIVQKAAEGSEALAGERLHANVEFTRSGDTYVYAAIITPQGCSKGVSIAEGGFTVQQSATSPMDGKRSMLNQSGKSYLYILFPPAA